MTQTHLNREIARSMLGERAPGRAKWDFGRLLLVCGSRDMPGAAVLAAQAALRSGVGLVRAASVEPVCRAVAQATPECTLLRLTEGADGEISPHGLGAMLAETEKSSAVLLGCGLGLSPGAREVVRAVITRCGAPLVVDADGLNALAESPALLLERRAETVLTPHIRELSRLTGRASDEIAQNPATFAACFAERYGVTVVLKGSDSYIAAPDGRVWLNSLDNSGLAKGGSGDALAGLIAGLLAQSLPPEHAAAAGVFIHSQAGYAAKQALTEYAMRVTDVISFIPAAFKRILDN